MGFNSLSHIGQSEISFVTAQDKGLKSRSSSREERNEASCQLKLLTQKENGLDKVKRVSQRWAQSCLCFLVASGWVYLLGNYDPEWLKGINCILPWDPTKPGPETFIYPRHGRSLSHEICGLPHSPALEASHGSLTWVFHLGQRGAVQVSSWASVQTGLRVSPELRSGDILRAKGRSQGSVNRWGWAVRCPFLLKEALIEYLLKNRKDTCIMTSWP